MRWTGEWGRGPLIYPSGSTKTAQGGEKGKSVGGRETKGREEGPVVLGVR